MPSPLTIGLLLLLLLLTLLAVATYYALPHYTAYLQHRRTTAQLTTRLAQLLNTRDSLIQHIDWARTDGLTERAAALTREVRSIDGEVEGVEKELRMVEAQRRRREY